MLIVGHIRQTVAVMMADSKIIGWLRRGSNLRLANRNAKGLPIVTASTNAQTIVNDNHQPYWQITAEHINAALTHGVIGSTFQLQHRS